MDVIVIGGGIIGLSSAYYLADRGADVTLFEKGSLGMGSTARSAGGIRSQFETPVNVELSLTSKEVWNAFEDEFGVDIQFRKTGYLFAARTEETAASFRDAVEMQQKRGAASEFLSPEEAAVHCEGLDPSQFVAASYNREDGFADPNLAVQGYASRADETGVTINTKTEVTDLLRPDDEVIGVETPDGRYKGEFVVNAAGAHARAVARMADVECPIHPRRRQIAVVEPETPVPEDDPLTIDLETGSYFRPERDGDALVGGQFEDRDPDKRPDSYDESMDLSWAASAVEHAGAYTSYFGPDARIKRGWAGLYAVTPDNHPIIEETVPGLITAAGFSGHGFQHAPATGQVVADLVFDGTPGVVDVSGLTSDRFERENQLLETNVV